MCGGGGGGVVLSAITTEMRHKNYTKRAALVDARDHLLGIAKPFRPQDVCQPGCKSARMMLSIKKKIIILCAAEKIIFVKIDFKIIKLANFDPNNLRLNL